MGSLRDIDYCQYSKCNTLEKCSIIIKQSVAGGLELLQNCTKLANTGLSQEIAHHVQKKGTDGWKNFVVVLKMHLQFEHITTKISRSSKPQCILLRVRQHTVMKLHCFNYNNHTELSVSSLCCEMLKHQESLSSSSENQTRIKNINTQQNLSVGPLKVLNGMEGTATVPQGGSLLAN